MNIPKLYSERTFLKIPSVERASAVVDFYQRNRDHFHPTNPPLPSNFYTKEFWEKRLEGALEEFRAHQSARFFVSPIDDESKIIGSVNFTQIFRGPFQACYLGYSIDKNFEGKGYMYEALKLGIEYIFNEQHLHRVMANYLPSNERSGNVLKRLGFKIDGRSEDYLYIHGAWREHVLTSLTNSNWSPREIDKIIFEVP